VPRVTAAITTYNRAGFVAAAVESALAQTYADYEVLLVDDGSTDGTEDALRKYKRRVRYHRQENHGRAAARNTALDLASGDYIAFLDSDDLWLPDKLARQVEILDNHPSADLVHGHVEMIDDTDAALPRETAAHRKAFDRAHRHGATYEGYALDCVCLTSTVMFRATTLKRLGGYDTRFDALEDLDLYLRLLLGSGAEVVEGAPLARYRLHAEQTSGTASTLGEIAVTHKHLALLEAGALANPRKAERNLFLRLAACHHRLVQPSEVRRWTFRAAKLDPSVLLRPANLRRLALSFAPHRARSDVRDEAQR
jgi:glycosyltransferase involved in cell wall biosynthesis